MIVFGFFYSWTAHNLQRTFGRDVSPEHVRFGPKSGHTRLPQRHHVRQEFPALAPEREDEVKKRTLAQARAGTSSLPRYTKIASAAQKWPAIRDKYAKPPQTEQKGMSSLDDKRP